jgi:hypothetical protein
MSPDAVSRWLAGKPLTLAEKAERCETVAELDGFVAGLAHVRQEPSREVIEAIARRRAQLRSGRR